MSAIEANHTCVAPSCDNHLLWSVLDSIGACVLKAGLCPDWDVLRDTPLL